MIQPFHVALADPALFQNATYAMNQVHFASVPTSVTNAYAAASTSVQKHVSLLDHIALLLVYKAKGDVVATGLLRERTSFTLVWAKNNNYLMSSLEYNYLSSLLRAFVELQHPVQILKLVIGMCKSKILTRVKKLVNAAPRVGDQSRNFFNVLEWDPHTENMRKFLVGTRKMSNQPLADGLDNFLADARGLSNTSAVESFVNALSFSYWISLHKTGPTLISVPGVNPIMFRRVKKLGAWFQACVVIRGAINDLPDPVRLGIRSRQLLPPNPVAHRPYRKTMDALNTWTSRFNLAPFDNFDALQDIYPTATLGTPGQGPKVEIAAAQHCELTVGLELWHILNMRSRRQDIEIGCSKASCFYCRLWIEEFNEWVKGHHLPSRLILRGQHDKHVLGWAMPANSPVRVRDGVLNGIGLAMQKIWKRAGGPRRLSDSQSPPSHPEEASKAADLDDEAGWGWGAAY